MFKEGGKGNQREKRERREERARARARERERESARGRERSGSIFTSPDSGSPKLRKFGKNLTILGSK